MNITYEDWRDFLYKIQAICSPAELHGVAAGRLCGSDWDTLKVEWPAVAANVMDIDSADLTPEQRAGLDAMLELTRSGLRESAFNFTPLLPADELPLPDRILALSQWNHGFLLGLGESAHGIGRHLDKDAQSFLTDMAAIAQADAEAPEEEQNEIFYTELVEFVRLGVVSLYTQLQPPKLSGDDATLPGSSSLH